MLSVLPTSFRRPASWGRFLALTLVVSFLWAWHYDRLNPSLWSFPPNPTGDALEVLARIHAASQGETLPFRPQMISRLGAPLGADWSAYPASDKLLLLGLGGLARLWGLGVTANLALLLAHLSTAWSFYGCARLLRYRPLWCWVGAVLFAVTYQLFRRGLPHLPLVYAWTVPLTLLTCWLIARSRRLGRGDPRRWLCVGTGAVLGVSNPYNLFIGLQLIVWAWLAQWLRFRRRENLRVGAFTVLAAVLAFACLHVEMFFAENEGARPVLTRNYDGTERYALKPIELMVPPSDHRWEPLAFFGHRYLRWSEWKGEVFSPYLGLVGIGGLLWMFGMATCRVLRNRPGLPAHAVQALWVLAYGSLGGLTNVMALFFGLQIFRATNRFSIFLSALALLFIVSRLTRLDRSWPWLGRVALGGGLLLVGVLDQIPRAVANDAVVVRREQWRTDRDFGRLLERELPRGAMLFQLPVLWFPEGDPPWQLGDYEHFRPYLATEHLRFSYGSLRGRARLRWQRETEELSVAEMVAALESWGFAGLYINRRGFADGGEGLLAALSALGREQRWSDADDEQVVVRLQPAAEPDLPRARVPSFGRGWYPPRPGGAPGETIRWAYESASVSYHNPYDRTLSARGEWVLSSPTERTLRFEVNGRLLQSVTLTEQPQTVVLPDIPLRPGTNRLDLITDEPAQRVTQRRYGLRAFGLHEVEIHLPSPRAAPE